MAAAIVTDSNSGIVGNEEWEKEIYVIPMPVILEGKTYYEGQNMSHEQFYRLLAVHKPVSTSQPAPADILESWEKVLESGYEEIVYIPMSSGLSSSFQTAKMLADEYDGKVQVVDNHRISVTQKQSVKDALWLTGNGCTAAEIREELEKTAFDSIIYVGVEILEYLKKGGRITPAAAAMGTLLSLKPLLTIQGEKRFQKQGIEISIGAAGSFPDREGDWEWLEMVKEGFPGEEIHYDPLTFSIGCHVGPGAFGMGISRKLG